MTEPILTAATAREHIGKFCYIVANGGLHYKAVHGRIVEVDRTAVWFEDNYGQPYYFKLKNVHSFELMRFVVKEEIPE
jgi:hypothetical protein